VRLTPRGRAAAIGLFLVLSPGFGSMLGTWVTGTPDAPLPNSPVAAHGEGVAAGAKPPTTGVVHAVRAPVRASRSRVTPVPVTGTRLDVTAYCPTGHRTASGLWPLPGMAAGNRWPFGTRLRVEGIGVVTVQDRYGWGTQLDLFMDSCAAARRFGRQHLSVQVLR